MQQALRDLTAKLDEHATRVEERFDSLTVTVASHGDRLDGIFVRQGEANHRTTKLETALNDLSRAVYKDQVLQVARQEWEEEKARELAELTEKTARELADATAKHEAAREREAKKWQYRISVILILAPFVFTVLVYAVEHIR